MIPKELDDLIKEYLTDGIISAKERQVLLKKAEQLGLDRDEVDLYIDAQQQKADQAVDAAASKKRGKTCPFCGGTVPQLADKCPHCGETITAEASEELQEIFDNLEEALIDFKSGKDIAKSKATVERYVRKAKMYYENNPKVQKLLAEVQDETLRSENDAKINARNKAIGDAAKATGKGVSSIFKSKLFFIVVFIAAVVCGFTYLYQQQKKDSDDFIFAARHDGITPEQYQEHQDKAKEEFNNARDQVTSFLSKGDIASAKLALTNIPDATEESGISENEIISIYQNVITACVNKKDWDSTEEVALALRAKLNNDWGWQECSCYKQLKALYKKNGRDFSTLLSEYDD